LQTAVPNEDVEVTNSDVTAEPQRGHDVTVPKAEVARVDYIRAALGLRVWNRVIRSSDR